MSSRNLMQRSLFSRPSRTCSGRSILMSCMETLATRFARRCSSCSSGERRLRADFSGARKTPPPGLGRAAGVSTLSFLPRPIIPTLQRGGDRGRVGSDAGGSGGVNALGMLGERPRNSLVDRGGRIGVLWDANIDGFSREIARFVILEARCRGVNHLRVPLCPEVQLQLVGFCDRLIAMEAVMVLSCSLARKYAIPFAVR